MKITINDKDIEINDGDTIQDVLESNNISSEGIATALNGTVVPATMRKETKLCPNDSLLIIKAFYGG